MDAQRREEGQHHCLVRLPGQAQLGRRVAREALWIRILLDRAEPPESRERVLSNSDGDRAPAEKAVWELVETCRRQSEGRDARLAWLRNELSRRSQMEIVEFQLRLDEATRQTFRWDLVAAAEQIFGGRCSDDDFDYFGLWMVGLGGKIFGRAVLDPDALADAPEVLALAGRGWRGLGRGLAWVGVAGLCGFGSLRVGDRGARSVR
ncbi:DUF4240 domain-containing protein [Streptomyces sp. NPDC088731]|uniref:DUF4240 domain-containing protein n=1 Tax=Streptomyces sp. NPDC088731 TaxID=3365878 RepID=UPI003816E795